MKLTPAEVEYFESGVAGFTRIDDLTVHQGPFVFVIIRSSDVSFDAGTTMKHGDAPDSADSFNLGEKIRGPFESIELSAGTVYAYNASFPPEPPAIEEEDYDPNQPGFA